MCAFPDMIQYITNRLRYDLTTFKRNLIKCYIAFDLSSVVAHCCIVVLETIKNVQCKIVRAYQKYVQDTGTERSGN